MKRVALLLLLLSLTFTICACSSTDNSNVSDVSEVVDNQVQQGNLQISFAPESFTSFEDFEQHEKEAGTKAVSCYYIPSSLPTDFELAQITKRDDVYVSVEYRISSQDVSAEELSEYDAERLQTLICRYSLYTDGESALEKNYINEGYEVIEYEGKTYYRWDEHAENNPEKQVIGYEIAFLDDGNLIFMHLPAVDTFENMMQYADVVKVDIN